MYLLKYVRLNRKDQLKNMRGVTLEVAMIADVSGAYSAISSVNLCVTGPCWHQPSSLFWMYLTLIGQQNVNGAALESWRLVMDNELRSQWPFATYLYIAGLWAYLQKIYKVKIYKTTYW